MVSGIIFLITACGQSDFNLDLGESVSIAPSEAVLGVDLDGDGFDTLLLVNGKVIKPEKVDNIVSVPGVIHALEAGDLDNDGKEEAIIATGEGKQARDVPQQVYLLDNSGLTKIWERKTIRNQVVDIKIINGQIWMVAFKDSKNVEAGYLDLEGNFKPESEGSLAIAQLPYKNSVIVGRIYGDEPKSGGDLTGPKGKIATKRGVKALSFVDLNHDNELDLLVSDGWYYAYGEHGYARVRFYEGPDFVKSRTLANFDQEYTVSEIQHISFNGKDFLLATSTKYAHLLQLDRIGWSDLPVCEVGELGFAAFIKEQNGLSVACSGNPGKVVKLR